MKAQNVVEYAPKFCFNRDQLVTLLLLQAEANAVMDEKWLNSTIQEIPYYRAAAVESTEAIQHYGYKWWKRTDIDLGQTIMELIDILHFALSDVIRFSNSSDYHYITLAEVLRSANLSVYLHEIGCWAEGFDFLEGLGAQEHSGYTHVYFTTDTKVLEHFTFNDLCEQLTFASLRDGRTNMGILFLLFEKLGVTPSEAFNIYLGKNALNKFRTKHGQLSHEYYKIWNGREDNEYLTDYINERTKQNIPITLPELESFLEDTYKQVENKEKK